MVEIFPRMTVQRIETTTTPEALRKTIQLIGQSIKSGAHYVPLRQYAAAKAAEAGPRDFLGQIEKIYEDVVKNRWRYVYDPLGVEMVATTGDVLYNTVLGLGQPNQRGFGDCDDIACAMGALAASIGLEPRIVTISKPGSNKLFDHVFTQIKIPRKGWISVDPVGHPAHGLGWTAPHERYAIWDLDGKLRGFGGNYPGIISRDFKEMSSAALGKIQEVRSMSFAGLSENNFPDYGLANYGLAGTDNEEPADWSKYGVLGFGAYTRTVPIIDDSMGLMMEYDNNDIVAYDGTTPLVRTKMLEMDPREIAYCRRFGRPRNRAVALSDDGEVYQWNEYGGLGGFFKKLFKKAKKAVKKVVGAVKKGVKKVVKGVSSAAKKLIKKLPGGKYLVKVFDKVKKIGMKLVKPLAKYLGPIAKKIAPIAALIPGYGPVISAALYKVGKIDQILKDYGVVTDKKGRPKFKSGDQAKKVTAALEKAAQEEKRKKKQGSNIPLAEKQHIKTGRLLKKGSTRHARKMASMGFADYWVQ